MHRGRLTLVSPREQLVQTRTKTWPLAHLPAYRYPIFAPLSRATTLLRTISQPRLLNPDPKRRCAGSRCVLFSFFNAAIHIELRDIGPKVFYLLFILDAWEDHFSARYYSLRVRDVFFECGLIPNHPRILVRV